MKHKTILLLLLALFGGQSILFAGEDDTLDTSFLGDSVLIFQTAPVPSTPDGGYFFGLSLLSADGVEAIIDRDLASFSCGDLSPNGRHLTFHSPRDSNGRSGGFAHSEIYVADSDGSGVQRLTFNEDDEVSPRWSPDGERLVFMGTADIEDTNTSEIYVIDANGDNFEQLTDNDSADRFPSWSPDGERIIFHSNRDGDFELYTMSLEGDDIVQLTDDDRTDQRARYSPEGAFIVFNAAAEDETDDLYVMTADGANEQRITDTPDINEYGAVWSPDGTMLAYTALANTSGAAREIWRINPDGSSEQVLADAEQEFIVCSWGTIEN